MNDSDAAPSGRASAATAVLDRAWGRSEQTLRASVEGETDADVLKRINAEIELEEAEELKALEAPSEV
jgi:hypothetical protein